MGEKPRLRAFSAASRDFALAQAERDEALITSMVERWVEGQGDGDVSGELIGALKDAEYEPSQWLGELRKMEAGGGYAELVASCRASQ